MALFPGILFVLLAFSFNLAFQEKSAQSPNDWEVKAPIGQFSFDSEENSCNSHQKWPRGGNSRETCWEESKFPFGKFEAEAKKRKRTKEENGEFERIVGEIVDLEEKIRKQKRKVEEIQKKATCSEKKYQNESKVLGETIQNDQNEQMNGDSRGSLYEEELINEVFEFFNKKNKHAKKLVMNVHEPFSNLLLVPFESYPSFQTSNLSSFHSKG